LKTHLKEWVAIDEATFKTLILEYEAAWENPAKSDDNGKTSD
jgi:hypothetical protein